MTKKQAIETIWEYMHMNHQLKQADAILLFCSNDTRVAEHAARLYHEQLAPLIVVSGDGTQHTSALLRDRHQGKKEAMIFKEILEDNDVPAEYILIEDQANNTAENFQKTKRLLEQQNIKIKHAIVVQKPYMERRTYATGKVAWPELDMVMSSPSFSFTEYIQGPISESTIVNLMVGDMQRIIEYPKKGFQIQQDIRKEVFDAYHHLVDAGFDQHLIK